jgi:non-specific serine/threonine protein kinase
MLETIREYGLEQLVAAGEETAIRDRHLTWAIDFVERAEPELYGAGQLVWLRRLEMELGNIRSALGWALERQSGELALRLSGALSLFWIRRGRFDEGRRWLEQALAIPGANVRPAIRATALLNMARLAYQQADYSQVPALEEALALFRADGDTSGEANALALFGMLRDDLGDHEQATSLEEEALRLFRMLDDRQNVARLLNSRGLAAYDVGDYDRATILLEESLSLARSLGAWHVVALALNNLALVSQERHDLARAMTQQRETMEIWQRIDNQDGIADCLENFAMFTSGLGELTRSAMLFGAAEAQRKRIRARGRPSDVEYLQRFIRALKSALGEADFAAAWAVGERMSSEEAIALARGDGG